MTQRYDYVVIGAGPAGIAAARTLADAGKQVVVFEQNDTYGGLCGSFKVNECTFDKFVHLSFAPEEIRNKWFNNSSLIEHRPEASNFYKGKWLAHPAINNLAPLPFWQKAKIVASFVNRPSELDVDFSTDVKDWNYYEWTKCVYGKYFADEFVEKYTEKYWGLPGNKLNTSWVGGRFQKPTLKGILKGMSKKNEKATFYTPMMYYPDRNENGNTGYVQILDKPASGLDIKYGLKCTKIDPIYKTCIFNNYSDNVIKYNHLIVTMPMPEIVDALQYMILWPDRRRVISKFKHTAGYMFSIVFDKPQITDKLWFYVYDKEIPPARFYSPSLCCPNNVNAGSGLSTLQGEMYVSEIGLTDFKAADVEKQYSEKCFERTYTGLQAMGIDTNSIISFNIRREKYANIIFDDETDIAKHAVQKILDEYDIINCGRFGKWEYLWSHQAWSSGVEAAKQAMAIR